MAIYGTSLGVLGGSQSSNYQFLGMKYPLVW
jgi:hypothetical protein